MENVQEAGLAAPADTAPTSTAPVTADSTNSAPVLALTRSRRGLVQMGILIGALLMMFAGQYQIFRDPPDGLTSGSPVLIAIGTVLLLVVLGNALRQQTTFSTSNETNYVEPVRLKAGWLLGSLVLAGYASWRTILKPEQAYLGEYLLVWAMVMLTLIMAALPSEGQPYARDKDPIKWREWLVIGALLIGALAMRAVNVGSVPYLMDQDEAKFADEGAALEKLAFQATPFEPGVDSHPRIYMMMISVMVGLIGPTLTAARLPSAIMGALGIPAVYLLGREIFGRRLALVAALFMMAWSYQIAFSRLSMNQPADPLFATLAFYFLLRGLRRGAIVDYMASGIFLGVAQMFYLGGRLAPFVMVAYLVYQGIREPQLIKRQWRALLIVPIAALIVILPQNFYLLYFHEPLSTRADKSILLNGEFQNYITQGGHILTDYVNTQIKLGFGALIASSDRSGWYGRGSNLMGLFGGPLLILGVIACVFMLWKYPKWCIPIGWGFTIIVAMCVLGISPPQYERYYPGVSAYALLAAAGVLVVATALTKVLQRPRLLTPILIVLGVLVCVGNFSYFMFDYVPTRGYIANRPNWLTNRIASQMQMEMKSGHYVVLVGGGSSDVQRTVVTEYFMIHSVYSYIDTPLSDAFTAPNSGIVYNKPIAFIVAPQRQTDLFAIGQLFPNGKTYEVRLDEDNSIAFYLYEVDKGPSQTALAR